jgi:hypothetical protein
MGVYGHVIIIYGPFEKYAMRIFKRTPNIQWGNKIAFYEPPIFIPVFQEGNEHLWILKFVYDPQKIIHKHYFTRKCNGKFYGGY